MSEEGWVGGVRRAGDRRRGFVVCVAGVMLHVAPLNCSCCCLYDC